MALTEVGIRSLQPRAVRYLVTDGAGLAIEVLPSGKLSWVYRYRLNGIPEKVAIGRYPATSLKSARQKRGELAVAVGQGRSPAQEKKDAKAAVTVNLTLREFGEKFFAEMVSRDRKDTRPTRRYLDREIYPHLGNYGMADITTADLQKVIFGKRDAGQPASAGQIRGLLKRIFDYAAGSGIVRVNPVVSIPMRFVSQSRSRTRALSPQEIRSYLHTIYRSNIRRQFKLALHIILLTLARKGEVMLAKWSHIDFETAEWQIPEENSKTRKPHTVFMSTQVMILLRELRELAAGSPWVLPGRSSIHKPFSANAMNQALGNLSFPIPPFTIHDMRRTGSTLLHEKGYPSDVVEKALNHTIGGVRGTYNRAQYGDQRKEMLQFWADFVDGIAAENGVTVSNFKRSN